MLNQMIDLLAAYAYTPDGGVADPNHPVYAPLWVLTIIAGG